MINIREILAVNLKKHRQDRGWSQAKLAEKTGTSTQYIGMIEISLKFPSSKMIDKLAEALKIDPSELFSKEIDKETIIKNAKKAAFEDIGDAVSNFVSDYVSKKIQEIE